MTDIEFLRFGSQIPGNYYGCCAVDIIQGLSCDPDALSSIQVTDGDSGMPYTRDGKFVFLGPTNLDVFKQRLRIGTFYHRELQNHAFLAVITGDQLSKHYDGTESNGLKWLKILKDHGFEFIRAVNNSVYSWSRPPVYLFGLFRNIGKGAVPDPLKPPEAWTNLPDCKLSQQEIWDRDKTTLLSEEDLRKAGAPVWLAGKKPTEGLPKIVAEKAEELSQTEEAYGIEDDEYSL